MSTVELPVTIELLERLCVFGDCGRRAGLRMLDALAAPPSAWWREYARAIAASITDAELSMRLAAIDGEHARVDVLLDLREQLEVLATQAQRATRAGEVPDRSVPQVTARAGERRDGPAATAPGGSGLRRAKGARR